jgi:hypothetical protein
VTLAPVTACHVNVDVVRTGPGDVVLPGPVTTGAGIVTSVGVEKYRYVLGGPDVVPSSRRRFQTMSSPAANGVVSLKLVADAGAV